MKKINIFLSIGNIEVEEDKTEIINFVRHLNDIYEDYGLYFYLMTSKNEIKKEEITSSEIYMILFNNNVDNTPNEEFNIAYREFKENKSNPKIYTYVKNMTKEKNGNALEFMKRLDKEIGHFYKNYNSTDTIKLNIIMQLQNLGLEEIKYETKDNKLYLNNEEALSLDNIPMFFNNKELKQLKEKYITLEKEKKELRDKTRENPDDEELFKEYGDAIRRFDELKLQIADLEKSIYEFEKTFIKTEGNETLTERQIYARECLEKGDIEAAKKALDFELLKKDEQNILDEVETSKEKARILVNEYIQSIDTLKLDINNKNRFNEIEEIFKEAISLEKKVNIERDSLFIYAHYLIEQNKNSEGINALEEYIKYCEYNDIKIEANVYYFLGAAYIKLNDYKRCEEYLNKTIHLLEDQNDFISKQLLTYSHFMLAQNSIKLTEFSKAEEYYKKAISKFENDKELNANEIAHSMKAEIFCGYAVLQSTLNNREEALKYGELAINEVEKNELKSEFYNLLRGEVYSGVGVIFSMESEITKAEEYLLKAEKILEKEYEINREKATNVLVDTYKNLAIFYMNQAENEKAKKYYKKCIKLCLNVDENNISSYENVIAICEGYLAKIYAFQGDYKNAEKNAKDANKYYLRYAEKTSIFNDLIVENNILILSLYVLKEKEKNALDYIPEAIDFVKTHDNINKENIFQTYLNVARIYSYQLKKEEAIKYATIALHNITDESTLDDINDCYTILGTANTLKRDYEEAIECFKIQEEFIKNTTDDNSLLEEVYENLEYCYNRKENYEEREKYLKLLLEICDKNDIEKVLDIYDNLVINSMLINNDDKTIEYGLKYEKMLETQKIEEKNIRRLYFILNGVGDAYKNKKEFEESEKYLEKVEEIFKKTPKDQYEKEKLDNKKSIESLYYNMLKSQKYDDDECKEISERAVHHLENTNDDNIQNSLLWHYVIIATVNNQDDKFNDAIDALNKAILVKNRLKKNKLNHTFYGAVLGKMGDTYTLLNNKKDAIKYYEEAVKENQKEEETEEYIIKYSKKIVELSKELKNDKITKKYSQLIEKLGGNNE